MIANQVAIPVEQEIISGIIIARDSTINAQPRAMFLHGGGPTSFKERAYDIAPPFLDNNINLLSIDFSGHGASSGQLRMGGSLKKRVQEAQVAMRLYVQEPAVLIGASMGGYIALKLLDIVRVDTLILMCPALYDGKAYDVPFDQGFTEIIRAHKSWRNTDALERLRQFTGKLLVVIGNRDEVIPHGVIELIMDNTIHAKEKELYKIPDCPHKINVWLEDHPDELQKMQVAIARFIAS